MSRVSGTTRGRRWPLPGPLASACLSLATHFLAWPSMHRAFPNPVCTCARPTCLLASFCSHPQSRPRESGMPYAEYGGWYKACRVSR